MSDINEYEERISIGDRTVVLRRESSPVETSAVDTGEELLRLVDLFSDHLRPANFDKADGTPMRLFTGRTVRLDLSKRSVEDMGFWHRNIDYNEAIVCLRGALEWETELGTTSLREGQMLWIPRGIAHRSLLSSESGETNVLLEIKIREDLVESENL